MERAESMVVPAGKAGQRSIAPLVWGAVLISCNLSLLTTGEPATRLVFFPDAVAAGEWWRVLTFPFVHVSLYHLAMDAAAFLLLWEGLRGETLIRRGAVLLSCSLGNLLLPLVLSPQVATHGLCGLSGLAHGLLVYLALMRCRDRMATKAERAIAGILAAGVVMKALIETVTGGAILAGLHAGDVGLPIPEAHLGGVLGGVAAVVFFWGGRKNAVKR